MQISARTKKRKSGISHPFMVCVLKKRCNIDEALVAGTKNDAISARALKN
jgi:hypothetical protein